MPPSFDWAGSDNLAEARVLYPVPLRLADAGMTSLGYKSEVVFPVEIIPRAPVQPIALKLALEYGVCKDICIPVEAQLSLTIPTGLTALTDPVSALVSAHLARVPRPTKPGLPAVASFKAELAGNTPRLMIEASFPQGTDRADVLIEIPGGELAPFAVITERKGNDVVRFEARFASAAEAQRFAGKPLLLTLFSANAQAEARAQMP